MWKPHSRRRESTRGVGKKAKSKRPANDFVTIISRTNILLRPAGNRRHVASRLSAGCESRACTMEHHQAWLNGGG